LPLAQWKKIIERWLHMYIELQADMLKGDWHRQALSIDVGFGAIFEETSHGTDSHFTDSGPSQ